MMSSKEENNTKIKQFVFNTIFNVNHNPNSRKLVREDWSVSVFLAVVAVAARAHRWEGRVSSSVQAGQT